MTSVAAPPDARAVYRKHRSEIVRVAALAYAGVLFLTLVVVASAGPFALLALGYMAFASTLWIQAPLTVVVEDVRAGRDWRGARKTLEVVYPMLGRITFASSLAAVGIAAGLYLLLVPGLVLLARWSLLVPVLVVERPGLFTAFARSRDLVRGRTWPVLGRVLKSGLAVVSVWIGVGFVTALLVGAALGSPILLVAIPLVVVGILSVAMPRIAIGWVQTYYELAAAAGAREPDTRPRLQVAAALDDSWATLKRDPARFLTLGALVSVPISLAQVALPPESEWGLASVGTTIVGYLWLEGLLVADADAAQGRTPTRRWLGSVARVAPRLPALVVAGVVAGVAVTATLPILVGLFLFARLSLVGAAVVADGRGVVGALRHSNALVAGHTLRVLKLIALTLVMAFLIGFGVAVTLASFGGIGAFLLVFAANAVTAPYVSMTWAIMHRQLRALRDDARAPAPADASPARVQVGTTRGAQ